MQRCPSCALFEDRCVCDTFAQVRANVSLFILRHFKERNRGSNTARILHASVQNSTIIDYGCPDAHFPDFNDFDWNDAALIFPMFYNPIPSHPPTAVEQIEQIKTLILLDGSWKQTSRMLKRIPELVRLPRLEIQPASPPLPRIRQPYFEGGMSTMEAGIQALSHFMTQESIQSITQNYLHWLDQVRQMSGLRSPLLPGQSFKEARKLQEETDSKSP